jgi:hypothetical protein
MNEVSIIINGVRYDAVDTSGYCDGCDLIDMCKAHCNLNLCEQLGVGLFDVFKKSTKTFER